MPDDRVPHSWRKSTRSNYSGCVEVRFGDGSVYLRNSRHPAGAVLEFTADEWNAFLAGVGAGEFDPPAGPTPPA